MLHLQMVCCSFTSIVSENWGIPVYPDTMVIGKKKWWLTRWLEVPSHSASVLYHGEVFMRWLKMNMWLWICTQYPLLNRYTSVAGIWTNIWLWSFPVEYQMDAKDSREQQTVDSQRRLELLKSIQGGHTNGFPLFFGPSIIPVIPFVSWWSVIFERSPAPALLVVHIQLQDGIGAGCEEISRRRHHLIHLSAVQWTPSSGSISCVFFPGFQKSMAWFERKLWCLDMFCLVSKTEGLLSIFSAPPNLACKSWWFCYSRLPRTKKNKNQ